MYRYLALIWDDRDPDRADAAARLIAALRARSPEWVWLNARAAGPDGAGQGTSHAAGHGAGCRADQGRAEDHRAEPACGSAPCRYGLALFHAGAREGASGTELLPANGGAIFGTLFRCGTAGPRETLSEADGRAIVASRGAALLDGHWGRYVAVVRTVPGAVLVLRDPTGGLPCLLARHHGVWMLFSDVEDVLALGFEPSINWPYVAALVADFGLQVPQTGLEQIIEVQPGESVELCGDVLERAQRWQPLRIARRDPLEAPAAAASALREAVRQCVHAWASCHSAILHRLSGGLDSSIVLAALRDAPTSPRITCLNYWGAGPQEDERALARGAAGLAACALVEQPYEPELTRLETALRVARTVRPYYYLYAIEHGRFEARLAAGLGATALFSGAGGDGLFLRERASLAAADALRQHGPGRRLLRAALDAAIIERTSLWSVLGVALRRGAHRAWAQREAGDGRFAHPWLLGARDALPGKLRQALSIGSPLPFYDPLGEPDDPEAVQPLLSQPVIEVCLRIPTPTLVSGGWDRAIARRAFRQDIPPQIVRRRTKGASTASALRIFESNRPFLRELLLDGLLVRQGLLDRRGLERTLAPGCALRDSGFVPLLLQHLSTEVWLRRWTCRAVAGADRDYLSRARAMGPSPAEGGRPAR